MDDRRWFGSTGLRFSLILMESDLGFFPFRCFQHFCRLLCRSCKEHLWKAIFEKTAVTRDLACSHHPVELFYLAIISFAQVFWQPGLESLRCLEQIFLPLLHWLILRDIAFAFQPFYEFFFVAGAKCGKAIAAMLLIPFWCFLSAR